ncbi:MAG: type II toxin-antitoxin system VapC family toxin, partial [Phormidesmis sp.]
DLTDLKALRLISIPTKALIVEAAQISAECNVSAYDASYVALSHQAQVPLLTLDKRLHNSLMSSSFDVQLFTNYEIPPLP